MLMVHFGGHPSWHREVWDMPHETWQWCMDVVKAREEAAQNAARQPGRR